MGKFTNFNVEVLQKTAGKKRSLLLSILSFFSACAFSYSQCNSGNQVSSAVYTPNYSGFEEQFDFGNSVNGRYYKVNVLANHFYTFYTYEAGNVENGYQDYITITDAAGNFLDFGPSPLQYSSYSYTGEIRCYFHSNSACATSTVPKWARMLSSTSLCMPPANLNETNVASNSVTLNWDVQNPLPSNGYQYYIVLEPGNFGSPLPPGNTADSGVTGFTLNNSVTLNNLSPSSRYFYWVRSNCGDHFSVWMEGGMFTTPALVCNQPTGLTVSNITANSALFSWQAPSPIPSNGYIFAFNTSGATPSADYSYPLSTSQFISNLASNTTYYYFVRSNCNSLQSNWVFGGSFTTPIGFNCNAAVYGLNPTSTYVPTCTGSPETIASNARAGEYSNIAVQPNKQYTFASSIANDYITITNESGTILYSTGLSPLTWQSGSNNETIRFFLHTNSSCGTNQASRSKTISCMPFPSCAPPSNLTSYNVGNTVASISWTASSSSPPLYDVYFNTSGAAPNLTTTPNGNINATAATINNLTASTTYYFWVRANCGDTQSAWINGDSFTTTGSTCSTPSNIIKSNITSASVQIDWTAATPVPNSGYQYFYNTVNSAPLSTTIPSGSSATTNITISGLAGSTTYYIWVRSNCGGSQSFWVSGGNFTTITAVCNPPSNLTSTGITSNSAQVNWTSATPAPTQYDVFFSTSSTAPNASTTPIGSLIGVAADLVSLTASTTYYFWVRSNCGTTQSTWIYGGSFTTLVQDNCTEAVFGLYPDTAFTPACSGTIENIVADAYAGEYSLVNILSDREYTFRSSVTSDYITITNEAATIVYANGLTPLVWPSGSNSGVIRYYFHTNSSCGSQNTNRTRSITCSAAATICIAPSSITAGSITNSQVTLQWSAVVPAPQTYQYYISTTNAAPTTTTGSSGSSLTLTRIVSGLLGSTTYYFWGRSHCGGSQSTWIFGGSFTTLADGNCTTAVNGLVPSATFTPSCSGLNEQITGIAWTSEYSNVAISANKEYTFTSSVATDYVTITNSTASTIYASGTMPLVWQSGSNLGMVRYYLHSNIACGVQNINRNKYIKCTNTLGTNENQLNDLAVFPNPTISVLHIKNSDPIDKVEIINLLGQQILELTIHATDSIIDMSNCTKGIYLVKVFVGKTNKTFKVVKN
jgi:hypothetical protein